MKILAITLLLICLTLLCVNDAYALINDTQYYYALDEESGTSILNKVGSPVNATKVGTPGQNNSVAAFNKSAGVFAAGSYMLTNATVSDTLGFTWNVWFNWTNVSTNMVLIGADTNAARRYVFEVNNRKLTGGSPTGTYGGVFGDQKTQLNATSLGWHMATLTYNITNYNWTVFLDGVIMNWSASVVTGMAASVSYVRIGERGYVGAETAWLSLLDEVGYWNRSLTAGEVLGLYNNYTINNLTYPWTPAAGAPGVTPNYNISILQSPNDINTTTFGRFYFNATITSNNTNMTNLTAPHAVLQYQLNTTLNNNCAIFVQQSCNTSSSFLYKNMTKVNNSYFFATLQDNNIFPAFYPYDNDFVDRTVHSNYTAYLNNYISFNVTNMTTNSNTQLFLGLEFQAMNESSSTASMLIFYCNMNWTGNNPALSSFCELIDSFVPNNLFSHVHNQSRHMLVPVSINAVSKTQQSYFVFVSPNPLAVNGWRFGYVLNDSYNNKSFKTGAFNSWAVSPKIFDIHIHQFLGTDLLKYNISFNDGFGNVSVSAFVKDYYNITAFAPSAPDINAPLCDAVFRIYNDTNTSIFFNWTPSYSINNLSLTYNLTIKHVTLLAKYNINTSIKQESTSFNWSGANNDYLAGYYQTIISVCDSLGYCDSGEQSCTFYLCKPLWSRSIQPCNSDVKLIEYYDANYCKGDDHDIPLANGTYEVCSSMTRTTFSFEATQFQYILLFGIFLLLFILFFILSGTFTPFFLIGDGLVLGLASFFLYNMIQSIASTTYSTLIFIFCLIISLMFLLGGLWLGMKGR